MRSFITDTKIIFSFIILLIAYSSFAQPVVNIGRQVWMLRNLNVSNFRNGDVIAEARTNEEWIAAGKEGKPAWCYYENKMENNVIYGKLYNWYAINDFRGIAPEGWHVPTDNEWSEVTSFLAAKMRQEQK